MWWFVLFRLFYRCSRTPANPQDSGRIKGADCQSFSLQGFHSCDSSLQAHTRLQDSSLVYRSRLAIGFLKSLSSSVNTLEILTTDIIISMPSVRPPTATSENTLLENHLARPLQTPLPPPWSFHSSPSSSSSWCTVVSSSRSNPQRHYFH